MGLPLHMLINNAGVFLVPHDHTQEGFEVQLLSLHTHTAFFTVSTYHNMTTGYNKTSSVMQCCIKSQLYLYICTACLLEYTFTPQCRFCKTRAPDRVFIGMLSMGHAIWGLIV